MIESQRLAKESQKERKSNLSYQVFNIRHYKLLSAILSLDNLTIDTETQYIFDFISPMYISFTISVALIYLMLLLVVTVAFYFYRKYQLLKLRYAELEKLNQDLLKKNEVLSLSNLNLN
jgi:hypothetical protein